MVLVKVKVVFDPRSIRYPLSLSVEGRPPHYLLYVISRESLKQSHALCRNPRFCKVPTLRGTYSISSKAETSIRSFCHGPGSRSTASRCQRCASPRRDIDDEGARLRLHPRSAQSERPCYCLFSWWLGGRSAPRQLSCSRLSVARSTLCNLEPTTVRQNPPLARISRTARRPDPMFLVHCSSNSRQPPRRPLRTLLIVRE